MNFKLIRFLDKYVGIPICLILKLLDRYKKYSLNPENPKKILLIKFWGLGSIILSSPLIKTFRDNFPNSKIYFLTMSKNKGLYDNSPILDKIIYVDIEGVRSSFNLLKTIKYLRKEKFDLTIDLEQFSRISAIMSFLTGSKLRVGFNTRRQFREILYTNKVYFRDDLHIIENYLNLARIIKIFPDNKNLVPISYSKKDEENLKNTLLNNNINDTDSIIGINVNTSNFAIQRKWPKEYFIKLSNNIIKKYSNLKIIFTGSEEESPYVEDIITNIKIKNNIVNLAGKIDIKQLAILMTKLKFYISNDSGPLHLASSMKCPTISFFGPETPVLYAPGNKNDKVFYKNFRCSPCITVYNAKNTTCNNNLCLKSISPEEVMTDINKRLGTSADTPNAILTKSNEYISAKNLHIFGENSS